MARAHNQPNKSKPEAIAAWKAALEDGMGYKHVSETFGVSMTTIRRHLPGMGWNHKQVTEHGNFMRDHNRKMRRLSVVG